MCGSGMWVMAKALRRRVSIEVSFLRVGVRLVFEGDVFVGVLCPVVLCGGSLCLGLSSVCVVLSRFGSCAL